MVVVIVNSSWDKFSFTPVFALISFTPVFALNCHSRLGCLDCCLLADALAPRLCCLVLALADASPLKMLSLGGCFATVHGTCGCFAAMLLLGWILCYH